jgi:hypothetical protein
MKTKSLHRFNRAAMLLVPLFMASQAMAQEEEAEPQPKVVCEEATYNFGEQSSDTDVNHTFIIKNAGDADLEITNVKAGCGCTTAELAKKVVPPGETTSLSATLSLARREGHQKKYIRVDTNDPDKPNLTLWFQGKAIKPFRFAPEEISFGVLSQKTDQTRSIKLTAGTDQSFTITSVDIGSESLTSEINTVTANREYDITLKTQPPFEEDTVLTVTINTDLEGHEQIEVPVKMSLGVGEVSLAPEKIVVEGGNTGFVHRQVVLGVPGLDEFKVLGVDTPVPTMRFVIARVKPNLYQVRFRNITPDESLNGLTATIRTDIEGHETLTVPFEYQP